MTWQKPDTSYWDNKFAAWWHDPIDKVLGIRKHEEWAAEYLQLFGIDRPNDEFWKLADAISAGFERGQVPTYNSDPDKNGAVDFVQSPVITHPTSGKDGRLKVTGRTLQADGIHDATVAFLRKHIGMKAGEGDYADQYKGDHERFARARLLYVHLVLRFILAERNVGGLGALWHRIPADSRFPDHSIWQHNALCSAISSCIELGGEPDKVALMVFSLTPVQGFIARARKMRDFWTGSVILSWLAFEGLRWIMENLGADHVLYPSLIDQPLVNAYLEREWKVSGPFKPRLWEKAPGEIASLPNKFLFLIPFGKADEIAGEIKKAITENWQSLARMTLAYLTARQEMTADDGKQLDSLFERQTSRFWDFQWAAARLAEHEDKQELSALLDASQWERQFAYLEAICPFLEKREYSVRNASRGILYSTSHSLVQSALAAEKARKTVNRQEEPGEKCQICGEFEVLHTQPWQGEKADVYKSRLSAFWDSLKEEQTNDVDFKENERLCAICTIKRLLPRVLKKKEMNDHILFRAFGKADTFPSTTEMALHSHFQRRTPKPNDHERRKIAQNLHRDEEQVRGEKLKNSDKYYAILLMDGDNMGKLINGETIAATWNGIMHPEIVDRLRRPDFDALYRDPWKSIYECPSRNRRLVTPAIHAAISEALADFSVYGVASIVKKHDGRLIYAGGDDVCAFMPIRSVLTAAREIRDYYVSVFRFIDGDRNSAIVRDEWIPSPGKLSVNLGVGPGISISAAVLICHHKESLTQMIGRAQQLLKDKAKNEAERNACAVELRKRHGGSRSFVRPWDDMAWSAFENIVNLTGRIDREISRSLLYRLEAMRPGIEAIIRQGSNEEGNLQAFIARQLERSRKNSDIKEKDDEKIAEWIGQIVWNRRNTKEPFNPEGLLIAGFLGGEGGND